MYSSTAFDPPLETYRFPSGPNVRPVGPDRPFPECKHPMRTVVIPDLATTYYHEFPSLHPLIVEVASEIGNAHQGGGAK